MEAFDSPGIDDLKGNIRESAVKSLGVQNNKGATPLMVAVELHNYPIFRFLLEMSHYNDSISKKEKSLPKILAYKNDKGENLFHMAIRTNQLDMTYSLMHLGEGVIS